MGRPPLRPAILVSHLKGGGKERFVVDLANALGALGEEPLVITFESGGALEARVDRTRVALAAIGKGRGNSLRLPLSLQGHLRRHGSCVVHSNNWGTLIESLLAAGLAGRLPVVHTQHGLDFERGVQRTGSPLRLLAKRLAATRLAEAVTVSPEVQQMVIGEWNVPPERVRVIANGIVVPPPSVLSACQRSSRRLALGMPADAFVVGTVGFLRPVKDYPTLVRAFASVRARLADAHLVIIGDGPSRGEVEATIAEANLRGSVHVLGARRDVAELLPLLDVFAMSSLSEGISLAILEAMGHALPVVVTRVGGNPHVIEQGRSGLLVEPGDHEGMAAALLRVAADPPGARAMGAAARARVINDFSVERMARDYVATYEHACCRRQ